MAIYAQPSFSVDLISDLDALTAVGMTACVKEDNGVYQRGASSWGRLYDWKAPAFGYLPGMGGAATQATSKATGVTLNKACGDITLNSASLAAATIVSFTLTNSLIGANDCLFLQHQAVGTFGPYLLNARCAAGSAIINVRNCSVGALAEAIVLRFSIIKGAVS